MRKLLMITVFGILILSGHSLFAQSLGSIGLKGGVNFAGLEGDKVEDFSDWKQGYMGGLFLSIKFGKHFAIRPEALYTQKGWEWTEISDGTEFVHSINLNYLDVPVLFVLAPVKFLQFYLGPSFGYFVDGTTGIEYTTGNITQIMSTDIDAADVREPEINAVVGVGLVLGSVSLEARYVEGRTHIWEEFSERSNAGSKAASVQMMLGVRF